MAVCDGDDAVEPVVFPGRGFEVQGGAHVVFRRVYVLTTRNTIQHFLWPVADASIGYGNQLAIVGFHHQTHVQSGRAITPQRLPVASTRKNPAAQPLALKTPAGDFADAPVMAGRGADDAGRL